MITLRDYQVQGVADIRAAFKAGRKAVCYVAPTGSGKTVLFSYIAQGLFAKGNRAWILCHRRELLAQTSAALTSFGVPHGMVSPQYPMRPHDLIQVASIQTIVNQKRRDMLLPPTLIIVDECHHAVAKTWHKVLTLHPAKLLGVTATPLRADSVGLRQIFDALVPGPAVSGLIDAGHLCKVTCYAPPIRADLTDIPTVLGDFQQHTLQERMNQKHVTGDAIDHYRRHLNGAPAIAFCVTVAHAEQVAREFQNAGIRSASVDGTMDNATRKARLNGLADGSIQVLTSCELISEGLDIPIVTGAILLRPTKSLGLHRQQIGRILRPAPGKARAVVLDHVGNLFRHGLPTEEINWTLDGKQARTKPMPLKECPKCLAAVAIHVTRCPECGYVWEQKPAIVEDEIRENADLEELKASPKRPAVPLDRNARIRAARSLEDMRALGKEWGYDPGWAWHMWLAMQRGARSDYFGTRTAGPHPRKVRHRKQQAFPQ